jgi:cell wall-associated NlpC family hydrolase
MGLPEEDLADRIKSSAQRKVGGPAGVGGKSKGAIECAALINEVLKSAGAKTLADFDTVSDDYVWGEPVDLNDVKPGDILQFRNHEITVEKQTLGKYKWETTSTEGPARRPHHTAVVVEVLKDRGGVVVVEQNVKPDVHKITRNTILRLDAGYDTRMIGNSTKIKITVTGFVKAYRAVAKTKDAFVSPQR